MSDVREGGCRCGRVRFKVTAPPMLTMACHCVGCQRMTGGPYSVSEMFPGGAFEVTAGEPVIGGLHGEIEHYHCGWCMSWVFTRPPTPMPMVNVRATMMDDAAGFEPFVEICAAEMLPWAKIPIAARSYPAFPPNEDWPGLISEYMQRTAG